MSLSFYMDENVSRLITEGLRRRGVDVLTVQEDGISGEPDPVVFDRAVELGRPIFSQDRDFLIEAKRRQIEGYAFPGVVYCRQSRLSVGDCISDLEIIAKACSPEELSDRVTYLPL